MSVIERQKVIKIGTQDVLCSYPNVKQKIKIENLKMVFTEGMYGELARSGHVSGNKMLDVVDAYSTIATCCPILKLDEEKFQVLDDKASLLLVQAYQTQIFPWFDSINKELNSVDLGKKEEEIVEVK